MKTDKLRRDQLRLRKKVCVKKLKHKVNYIAGADVAVTSDYLIGCIGIFLFPSLELIEQKNGRARNNIPYIPGFLSFREIPVLMKCYKKLKNKPDLILVDGQGIAHPRRLGLATHLGIILNKPTIGCAKSHLFGDYEMPDDSKGSYALIKDRQETIGLVLRTKDSVRPLFVSPGHLVDAEDCHKYVMLSLTKYRIPEPIRFAHKTAGEKARQYV